MVREIPAEWLPVRRPGPSAETVERVREAFVRSPHVTKGAHIEQLQGWTKIWRDSLSIHMLLSAVSVLVVAQSIFEIPEGLMNNPVYIMHVDLPSYHIYLDITLYHNACFLQPTSWCWTFAARNMWTSFCKIKIIRITTVHQIGFKCHS